MKNGGPAFPNVVVERDYIVDEGTRELSCTNLGVKAEGGMSLRDWFAGRAMSTLLHGAVLPTKADRDEWFPRLAGFAYELADAMLAEREKQP